ncbi:MAG: hypothetical protein MI717_03865 [Spirochaetales bacterium]|nr:hypothetical protein [Spirochaetales bacterium]
MQRISLILLLTLAFSPMVLPAVESGVEVNTIFQGASLPLFGDGGKNVIRYSGAGAGIRVIRGELIRGIIDVGVLIPYSVNRKDYPATKFSPVNLSKTPFVVDTYVGIGTSFEFAPMVIFASGGFHTATFLLQGNYVVSFGMALDAMCRVDLASFFSLQFGLRGAMDFGGIQNFSSGSGQFAGVALFGNVYAGFGFRF